MTSVEETSLDLGTTRWQFQESQAVKPSG